MYAKNSNGPSTLPCGTPLVASIVVLNLYVSMWNLFKRVLYHCTYQGAPTPIRICWRIYLLSHSLFSACDDDIAGGLFWTKSRQNTLVTQPCSNLHPNFRSGVNIKRQCLSNGSWSSFVDMSDCTMFRDSYPVVVVYFAVSTNDTHTVNSSTIINNVSV